MQASILDLRYRMKSILCALERNETVEILYHGKKKGIIIPYSAEPKKKSKQHPYFGMTASDEHTIQEEMDKLRGGRYRDL